MFRFLSSNVDASTFTDNVELSNRAYDNKWVIWAKGYYYPVATLESPNNLALAWGQLGVFDSEKEASKEYQKLKDLVSSKRPAN